MHSIIQISDLIKLKDNPKLLVLDARSGPESRRNYKKGHLNNAIHIDLESELATVSDNPKFGGRHPLPTARDFTKTLRNLGVSKDHHIVIYDDKNGANAAARLWWMLRAVTHKKVQVLNGTMEDAQLAGFEVNSKLVEYNRTSYSKPEWKLPVASMIETEEMANSEKGIVIDVRASQRYAGEIEPIDLIAGHIPGAINIPFANNLDSNGKFKSPQALQEMYAKIIKGNSSDNIIVHCGSGVTACHTILAMDYADLPLPKLYVGSWSEWSRNDKPIATGE